ncbi:PQQ-binding-like beta-propeller repeat protein [Dactylosporangium sp. CS-047395]|uniref:outer membrane protein assembly factor BamB family protein n=1 Tax=Dactylosporangium sp. CS-047395 TaxID=3239936 RepID=UPI003D8ED219
MSTELDPFFAALRHDAEALPAANPAQVRDRGRRRGRRRALATGAAAFAVVAVIALAIGIGLPHGRPHGGEPATPGPTSTEAPPRFEKLTPVGSPVGLGAAAGNRLATVQILGDRAFVCVQSEAGQVSVAAVDLATGRKVWGPLVVATFRDTAVASWHPKFVVVMGRHDDGTRPDGSVLTLDPATGKPLLQVDVDAFEQDDIVLGESTLVIGSRAQGTTRGYDLATGQVRWTVPDPSSRIVHSLPMQIPGGPGAAPLRSAVGGPFLALGQFVQFTADGTAIVRDVDTGAESSRRTGALSPSGSDGEHDDGVAVGGVLYAVDHASGATIRATDLTIDQGKPAAATTTVYTAGPGARIGQVQACGPGRICFTEQRANGMRLVDLDTGRRRTVWTREGVTRNWHALDGQVLVNGLDEPGGIYDAAGRQLLKAPARTQGWIDPRSALLFTTGNEVLGVAPLDGEPVPLGAIGPALGLG